ncbi:MAG: Chromosome-partitioning protein Spo0J [bacterium ADurb.Bin429]|nr:MAG: Chromosome-partitioning protein Spo0J [bacterium ADurb.Bin429]
MLKRRSGLGSLIPGAELNTGSGPEFVPISAIAVNPYQPRRVFAPEALEELAESIRQHGILQPLTVRPREGGYELIAGERRLQAARRAGLAEVPVMVRECDDREMLELALVENLQREDLNPMEAARSYQQLLDEFGMTQADVAARVGKSRPTVANTLRLLALPAPIQSGLEAGAISEGHARALLAAPTPERQLALFRETVSRGLSVRAVEALAAAAPTAMPAPRKKTTPPAGMDANLLAAQETLQRALGVKVRFRPGATGEKGVIEIEYYTTDDLERIYEIVTRE